MHHKTTASTVLEEVTHSHQFLEKVVGNMSMRVKATINVINSLNAELEYNIIVMKKKLDGLPPEGQDDAQQDYDEDFDEVFEIGKVLVA